ncbi:MAG: lipopolysaccharide biosynthesis protein [Alphaproteobacteria bacterium]
MSVRRSLAFSLVENYGRLLLNFAPAVILARLLTPAEIGIFSLSVAFIGLAHMLREFGVMNFLVQEKDLTEDKMRTAFTVAFLTGAAVGVAILLARGPMARFYDETGVERVLGVLALNFFVIPFGMPVLGLLQREMRFDLLLRINMTGALVQVAVTLTLAFMGFSYMSMAWGSLAGAVATALAATVARPAIANPRPSLKAWRTVFAFGGKSSLASLVNQLGVGAPEFVAGRLLGFAAVGLYSRAMSLFEMFRQTVLDAVWSVALPAFAASNRTSEGLAPTYLLATSHISVIAWPFFGFVGFMAFPVIRILFGDQWDAAVPAARIVSFAIMLVTPYLLSSHAIIAMGEVGKLLRIELASQVTFVVFVAIGALYSLEAMVAAHIVAALVRDYFSQRYLHDLIGVTFRQVIAATGKSLAVLGATVFVPAVVAATVEISPTNLWPPFLIAASGAAAGWLIAVFALDHPVRGEILRVWTRARAIGLAWRP